MRGIGVLLNDQYDLQVKAVRASSGKIVSGLLVGDTLRQNQALILVHHPGEFTEMPELGVGIEDMLLDNDYLMWKRQIRLNMEMDGQKVDNIIFSKYKQLKIEADYH